METLMRRPYTALPIYGNDGHVAVETGEKRICIRAGHRDYQEGDVLFLCCDAENWCGPRAQITYVRHTVLGDITIDEYKDDGFKTYYELEAALQNFYPGISVSSEVTVVRWKLLV